MAISRVFAANRDIIVMDEPSAALDPLPEAKIMENLDEYTKDKTVIIVSHRTHAKLYAKGGIYTEMFDKQSQ